jgi:hypothetical protein
VIERLPLRVETRKRRQERRMNVEDARWVGVKERPADEAHVAREAHEADVPALELAHDRAVAGVAIRVRPGVDVHRLDPGVPRARKSGGFASIRDDDGDLDVESPGTRRVDYRLKVGSSTRNEDAEAAVHR